MKQKAKIGKIALYPITLEPHKEGGYFAYCPSFQGCRAEGKTIGEAIDNLRDVMRVHIEARKEFGEFIPSVEISHQADLRFTVPLPIY